MLKKFRLSAAMRIWLTGTIIVAAVLVTNVFQVMILGERSGQRTFWAFGLGDALMIVVVALLTRRLVTMFAGPVNSILDATAQLDQGVTYIHVDDGADEFGDLSRAFNAMSDLIERARERRAEAENELLMNTKQLESCTGEFEAHKQSTEMTRQMAHRLSSCANEAEWAEVCERFVPQMTRNEGGAVYLTDETGRLLRPAIHWGGSHSVDTTFEADDCWAVRRKELHLVRNPKADVVCRHIDSRIDRAYCCIPLVGQNESLGILCLEGEESAFVGAGAGELQALAETASTSLSNLRLRLALRDRALRDPSTKLFSRRFLEESWTLEAPRSERANATVALMLVEIDNFGAIANHYGREAADAAFAVLGRVLQASVRAGDVVCRYGADRIAIMQSAMTQTNARATAERLCAEVRATPLRWNETSLGTATASIGIAVFPYVGPTFDAVVRAAGDALDAAAEKGGDCAELAVPIEGTLFPLPRVIGA